MPLQQVNEGGAAGCGHLLPFLPGLRPLCRLPGRGHVAAETNLHHIRESYLLQGAADGCQGNVLAELALNGRCAHGIDLLAGLDGTDHIQHLYLGADGAEGAGMHALSATHALLLIDDADAIVIIADGIHRTSLPAGTDQVCNGAVGTGIGTHTAFLTLIRVNVGPGLCHGDGTETTAVLAGLAQAETTVVSDRIRRQRTLLTGRIDDLHHIGDVLMRITVLVVGQPHSPLQNLPLLVNAAAEGGMGSRCNLVADIPHGLLIQIVRPLQPRHPFDDIMLQRNGALIICYHKISLHRKKTQIPRSTAFPCLFADRVPDALPINSTQR